MGIAGALVVFFITWWVVLFAVLPLWVRRHDEIGEDVPPGTEPAAPAHPQIAKKLLVTTAITAVIWVAIFTLVTLEVFSFREWVADWE